MIDCRPIGICSWNFSLEEGRHRGNLQFFWAGESGSIVADGEQFRVEKDGMFSGKWKLARANEVIAVAEKRSAFQRSFDLTSGMKRYTLSAESFAGRTMVMEGRACRAVMAPAHPFTRRATIHGQLPDFHLSCFGFWLTVLTWRRAANNAAAG